VTEEQMVDAVRRLYLEEGVLAEPAGAATTAAWLRYPPVSRRAVLLVTGGNISDAFRRQAGI
jgi:threonine synthase